MAKIKINCLIVSKFVHKFILERERESQADSVLTVEPNVGLDPTPVRS